MFLNKRKFLAFLSCLFLFLAGCDSGGGGGTGPEDLDEEHTRVIDFSDGTQYVLHTQYSGQETVKEYSYSEINGEVLESPFKVNFPPVSDEGVEHSVEYKKPDIFDHEHLVFNFSKSEDVPIQREFDDYGQRWGPFEGNMELIKGWINIGDEEEGRFSFNILNPHELGGYSVSLGKPTFKNTGLSSSDVLMQIFSSSGGPMGLECDNEFNPREPDFDVFISVNPDSKEINIIQSNSLYEEVEDSLQVSSWDSDGLKFDFSMSGSGDIDDPGYSATVFCKMSSGTTRTFRSCDVRNIQPLNGSSCGPDNYLPIDEFDVTVSFLF